jgi:hypothetical protein
MENFHVSETGRDSTVDLLKNKASLKAKKLKKIAFVVVLLIFLVASLLLLLVLIPISYMIRDEVLESLSIKPGHNLIQLVQTNSLWYWSIRIRSNESITFYLTDEFETFINDYTVSGYDLSEIFYALPSSLITLNDPANISGDLVVNVSSYGNNSLICTSLPCLINRAGYYQLVVNSQQQVTLSLHVLTFNATYYDSYDGSTVICYATECSFELDKLHPYYILANTGDVSANADCSLYLYGRQSWYFLTIFLLIPTFIIIMLLLIAFCL